jgi:hypothetical protein
VVNVVATMNEVMDCMADDELVKTANEPGSSDDGPEAVEGGVAMGVVVSESRIDVELAGAVDKLEASDGAVEVEFA